MYSKPKSGLYIKHRDRTPRRHSPRTSDEADGHDNSDLEGRLSPRVEVENYGEGHISANSEPKWPKEFEEGASQPNSPREAIASTSDFPARAKKYMVTSNSYRDLTGEKYITVPEPKAHAEERLQSVSNSGSAGSHGQRIPSYETNTAMPSAFVKPVARVQGTYRGIPANVSAKQSHLATLRVYPSKSSRKMHTVRAIPRDGTMRSLKSYHIGPNATLRAHNTGNLAKHLKHSGPIFDPSKGTLGFRRTTVLSERKEYCFSQFAIELDRPSLDGYLPGDVLSGKITLEVVSKVEVRFVELLIIGLASVHFSKHDPKAAKDAQEVIISKRSFVMGTPDGRWNSLITPGKYVSRFKFVLPNYCPSSIKYEKKEHGFSFEIGYLVKARICDEFGSSSARSNHSINNYVKVLLSRRHPFLVRQPFDINSIPKALQPVTHSEFVNLGCIPIFVSATAINLSLDRSVFLAGDEIRVKLVTPSDTSRKIKSLTVDLQQKVQTSMKTRHMFNVVQVHVSEPEGLIFRQDKKTFALFEFILPTHMNFIPSFMKGCKLIHVTYTIVVTMKFKLLTGKLFLECPIGIGPCEDPVNLGKTNTVPVFNRPKRFPHFSKETTPMLNIQNGTVQPSVPERRQVSARHKSRGTKLMCCCVEESDFD